MENQTVVMDFSGVYREESFWEGKDFLWLDFSKLQGVNCYCTPEAEEEIKKRLEGISHRGIHFLDSGNYHYVSKFWLEKIKTPFSLLVFDNHTDMQESSFFGLLSCGSWVREALRTNPFLQEVCLIGPSAEAFAQCKEEDRERVTLVSREELRENRKKGFLDFLQKSDLPLYMSIDKDLLNQEAARTNWDQGEVSLEELTRWIREALESRRLEGADICGENPRDTAAAPREEELRINSRTNEALEIFLRNGLERDSL